MTGQPDEVAAGMVLANASTAAISRWREPISVSINGVAMGAGRSAAAASDESVISACRRARVAIASIQV